MWIIARVADVIAGTALLADSGDKSEENLLY